MLNLLLVFLTASNNHGTRAGRRKRCFEALYEGQVRCHIRKTSATSFFEGRHPKKKLLFDRVKD